MTSLVAHVTLACGLVVAQVGPPATQPPPQLPASAEESSPARAAAQAALAAGNRHLKEGDAGAAVSEYRRAQALYPPAAAKIEFNVARAEQLRGDTAAAANALELFLAQPADISGDYREEALQEIRRLAPTLVAIRVTEARRDLLIVIDEVPRGSTPMARNLWVRPGDHEIVLKDGERLVLRRSIDPDAGVTVSVSGLLAVPPSAVVSKPAPPGVLALGPLAPPTLVGGPSTATPPDQPSAQAGLAPTRPFWKQWWFWAGSVAVLAAATTTVILLADRCPANVVCMEPR